MRETFHTTRYHWVEHSIEEGCFSVCSSHFNISQNWYVLHLMFSRPVCGISGFSEYISVKNIFVNQSFLISVGQAVGDSRLIFF